MTNLTSCDNLKETLPFSFDEIYQNIKQRFADKGYDSPYDGSDISMLITSMTYLTSMLNANTAININENILTLAQKRPNVIQDARMLGYESFKKVSFVYDITLVFDCGTDSNGNLIKSKLFTIPKYSAFLSNSKKYYYLGSDIEVQKSTGDKLTIPVKEGTLFSYPVDNNSILPSVTYSENLKQVIANQQYLDIPYKNIERDGIEVFVTYYTSSGIKTVKEPFYKSESLLLDKTDNMNKKFIRIDNDEMGTPVIYFVLSGVGFNVPKGAIVEFVVLQSSGPDGVMTSNPSSPLKGIKVSNFSLKIKGSLEESNKSIKSNAPLLYNTASRCVIANDYEVVCKTHPACKEAIVFGGEDEHPQVLGNLFFCLTPSKAKRDFTNDSENTLYNLNDLENLDNNYLLDDDIISTQVDKYGHITDAGVIDIVRHLNLPSLQYNIRNPLYIIMNFNIKIVRYAISTPKKDIRNTIFKILSDYIETLEKPETEFFKSNIIKLMDEYLTNASGLELDVNFQIMLTLKNITYEDIEGACDNTDPTKNPYLNNPLYEKPKEHAIYMYFSIPFEGIYNEDGSLDISRLPNISCENFEKEGKTLRVDFTSNTSTPSDSNILDKNKKSIKFNVLSGNDIVGKYFIYNDLNPYIKIKIYFIDSTNSKAIVNPKIHQIDNSVLVNPKYITLTYPSKNFSTVRNSIFKLNQLKII